MLKQEVLTNVFKLNIYILYWAFLTFPAIFSLFFSYSWFHIKGTWSVHSFNVDYLSISEGTGSCWYLFHEIPGTYMLPILFNPCLNRNEPMDGRNAILYFSIFIYFCEHCWYCVEVVLSIGLRPIPDNK